MFQKCMLPYIEAVNALQSRHALGSQTIASIAALAVATAISRNIPLPDNKVENPQLHYNNTHLLRVRERVALYNEASVLRYEEAVDLTKKLWLQREWSAYCRSFPLHLGGYLETVTGFGLYFSEKDLEIVKNYGRQVLELAAVCVAVEQALTEEQKQMQDTPAPVAF